MSSRAYRLRPAPRSSGRARGSRIHWDKLGRVVLVIVIFAILISYINPAINLFDAWSDARNERSTLTELQAENKQLRNRLEGLEGDDAAERSARKQGMVAEGERPYTIRGLGRDK